MIKLNLLTTFLILFFFKSSLFPQGIEQKIDSVNSISYEKIVSNLQYYIGIFEENLRLAQQINYAKGEGLAMSNLALVHYLRGNYDLSTEFHLKAIELFEKNKMYKELSESYGEYGYQLKRRDMDKAKNYMRVAIAIAVRNKVNELTTAKLYDNYGVLQEMSGNFDSAFYYYNQALKIKEKYSDSLGIPYSLNKIAVLKSVEGDLEQAFNYLFRSNAFREKESGSFGRAENLSIHADFLRLQNKIDSAIILYKNCLDSSINIGYNYLISYCYSYLTDLYKKKGNYKQALEFLEKYNSYKDSLTNYQTNATIAQLEVAYETEQKNKLIRETELLLVQKNQQLLFSAVVIVFLLITSVGIFKYQKQRRERLVNELELRSKINNALIEKRIIQEKLEISRELHDNIGSQLTFLISSINHLILKSKDNSIVNELMTLKDFGRETLKDLRNTVWAMKEESGDVESLIIKIYDLISKLKYPNVEIKVENLLSNNIHLSSTQKLNLFRIAQEALQNSIKHSDANFIKVVFCEVNGVIEMRVEDNGKGFNVSEANEGSGLANMKIRAEKLGGSCYILSDSNGTKVICQFGINKS